MKEILDIIKYSFIDEIYLTGFVDTDDTGVTEFTALMRYLFFEFNGQLLKIESVEQYSKLSISQAISVQLEIDLEDVIPAKSRISNIIFNNPLIDNKVAEIEFYNLQVDNLNEILCDALKIILQNKQEIFLDPSFLGINIGPSDVEKLWRDNLAEDYVVTLTRINFET
ncbi:hypothetical protein [Paenibacillus tyrfis]|uniref:Uncharacterized protein n=1 Tax=Paenibacillus tyrfis TaxID=1501230 RepID=A0A081P5L0_9BACL|nr:hypothetical protein [Paenibacillus tyrfis]KEQ25983.1 hypothetical protein ET33_35940 [Paenibacillus tyrfis]